MTPIEALADELILTKKDVKVAEVLVPEQCMIVYINGKAYHVTIEEITQ